MIRPAERADAAAVARIYGYHVLTGLATFEETQPDVAEIAARMVAVSAVGLPYLVTEVAGEVAGFAYAAPLRSRSAYRYSVEDSIYLAPEVIGRGLGRSLLGEVIAWCERMDLRQMLAVVGDSANVASIGLHRALGFEVLGTFRGVGFKHGRWVDTVWLQRPLNDGEASPPAGVGLAL